MTSSPNEIVLWARRYIGLTCERLHLPWLRLQNYSGEAALPSFTLFLKYGDHGQRLKCTVSNCELVTGGFGQKRSVASELRMVFSHRRKVRLPSGPDSLSWDQADSGRRVKCQYFALASRASSTSYLLTLWGVKSQGGFYFKAMSRHLIAESMTKWLSWYKYWFCNKGELEALNLFFRNDCIIRVRW